MSQPFLPKLKKSENTVHPLALVLPHSNGNWDEHPGYNRLRHIAEALDIPPGITHVYSIPDPWARPILFWRALYDADHPLHARIEGEWRGTMALLGLSDIRHLNRLSVQPVDLSEQAEGRSAMRKVIAKLLPNNSGALLQDATWQNFHLLRWTNNGSVAKAFALSSPWTLVATAAEYTDVLDENEIPWFRGGLLTDPCDCLSSNERAILAEWLLHIRHDLAELRANINAIGTCLESFARDLDPTANGQRPKEQVYSSQTLGFTGQALHSVLDRPAVPFTAILTDCAIYADRPTGVIHVLVDESVPAQLHRPAREVTVYQTITMETASSWLPALGRSTPPASGHLPAKNGQAAVYCTKDYFFEKCLLFAEVAMPGARAGANMDAFPGCRTPHSVNGMHSVGRSAVVPLRAEVLELLSPDYIEKNLTIEWLPTDECKVRLTLGLQVLDAAGASPAAGSTQSVVLERVYSKKETVRIQSLPPVCVWPNFRFRNTAANGGAKNLWSRYYLFESWRGSADNDNKFYVSPHDQNEQGTMINMPADVQGQADEKCRVTVLDHFPEALRCTVEQSGMTMPGRSRATATGLLLLKAPTELGAMPAQKATLGIDFGTTGTTIYSVMGEDTPRQMVFQDHLLSITNTDPNEFNRITRDWFLPRLQPSSGHILSVYQDFGSVGKRVVVRDGHVLFLQDNSRLGFVNGNPKFIRTNLKWSEDKNINLASQDFLVQLCLQSLAELVPEGANSVEICYSYPTAFSTEDLGRLKTLWDNVVRQLSDLTSVGITLNGNPEANCEAIAAARYFAENNNMVIGHGAISLDIGGGTTDIAVWNRDTEKGHPALLTHMSIKFAGQDIFLEALRRNPGVLEVISNTDQEISEFIQGIKRFGASASAYNAEIDAIISRFSERLLLNLPAYAETAGVRDLLQIVKMGLEGIAFYVGMQVGYLIEKGIYASPQKRISVFVGGNGARLFYWCGDGLATKHFGESLLVGANLACGDKLQDYAINVTLSDKPKEEVAYGLIMPVSTLVRNDKDEPQVPGEDYWVGVPKDRERVPWNAGLNFLSLGDKPISVDPELHNFKQFLNMLGTPFSANECARLVEAVDHEIEKMRATARDVMGRPGGRAVRDPVRKLPLFILALRGLMNDRIRVFSQHKFSNGVEGR